MEHIPSVVQLVEVLLMGIGALCLLSMAIMGYFVLVTSRRP